MQIKTKMSYLFMFIRLIKVRNMDKDKCWYRCGERGNSSLPMHYSRLSGAHLTLLSQINNIHTPNPAVLPLGIYFKENLAWVFKRMFMRRCNVICIGGELNATYESCL